MIGTALGGGSSPKPASINEASPKAVSNTSNSETEATTNTETEPTPTEKVASAITVNTSEFISEYDKNQLAAEEKYKDELIQLTAKVKNISEDIMGTPFLSLEPENADQYYYGTSIKCSFEEKSALTALENGQLVTVKGTASEQSLGIISINQCQVVK